MDFDGADRFGRPAWDTGRPQPAIVGLAGRDRLRSPQAWLAALTRG